VIVETCYFLDAKAKIALLNWLECGAVKVVDVPVTAYSEIALAIEKYADHEIDFTDAALIWLANQYQQQQILTVDKADFSAFRLKNNQWFDLLAWY
jgi:predicted nucleic acid-binding protein